MRTQKTPLPFHSVFSALFLLKKEKGVFDFYIKDALAFMGPNYTPPCGICQEVLQHFFLILQKTEKQQKIPFRNGSAVGSLTKGRPQSALSSGTAEQEPSHRTDAAALIISGAAVGTRIVA